MAGFKTFLSGIVHFLAKAFSPGALKVEAGIASIILPGFGGLINATVGAIINAEVAAVAAGQQTGSGPQKLAWAVASINDQYIQFAKENNLPVEPQAVTDWVQRIFNIVNLIPFPGTAPAPAPPTA